MISELKGRERTSWCKLDSYTSLRVMPWVQLRHFASNSKMEGSWDAWSSTPTCVHPLMHMLNHTHMLPAHIQVNTHPPIYTHTYANTHKWLPFVLFLVLSVSVIKVTNLDGSQKSICRWLCLNSYHPWCYLNISGEFLKYCSYRWHLNNSL